MPAGRGASLTRVTTVHLYTFIYRAFHNILRDYKYLKQKTKRHTLMELFTTTGKVKMFFHCNDPCQKARIIAVTHVDACLVRTLISIDVCRVTRGAHIEHL
jgi:hypothetical protein